MRLDDGVYLPIAEIIVRRGDGQLLFVGEGTTPGYRLPRGGMNNRFPKPAAHSILTRRYRTNPQQLHYTGIKFRERWDQTARSQHGVDGGIVHVFLATVNESLDLDLAAIHEDSVDLTYPEDVRYRMGIIRAAYQEFFASGKLPEVIPEDCASS